MTDMRHESGSFGKSDMPQVNTMPVGQLRSISNQIQERTESTQSVGLLSEVQEENKKQNRHTAAFDNDSKDNSGLESFEDIHKKRAFHSM
jgi:hypothetical protein